MHVDDLRVCSATNAYEGVRAELYACESLYGVGMLVLYRDGVAGEDGRVKFLLVSDDVGPIWGWFECFAGKLEVVIIMVYDREE